MKNPAISQYLAPHADHLCITHAFPSSASHIANVILPHIRHWCPDRFQSVGLGSLPIAAAALLHFLTQLKMNAATSTQNVSPLQAMGTLLEIPPSNADHLVPPTLSKDEAIDLWYNAKKSKLKNRKKDDLVAVLLHQGVIRSEIETLKKDGLFEKIQSMRKEQRIIDIHENILKAGKAVKRSRLTRTSSSVIISQDNNDVKATIPVLVERNLLAHGHIEGTFSVPPRTSIDTSGNADKYVLGKTVIPKIREDMDRLTLPSWVSRGPAHPGEAKGGKLHADQWRSFFTINLPISLTRLWGSNSADSKKQEMLVNFLHLVTAVQLASRRTITEEHVQLYEEHMYQYLATLLPLYPSTKM
ncbi:hypothetical protein AGABI1DRAFT_96064, partial [Agaricus bisporus var. burnettii JB137-S8]